MVTSVTSSHPNPATQYAAGVATPAMHPPVSFPVDALPSTHPAIDTVLKSPSSHPLPAWHPILSKFVNIGGIVGTVNPSNRVSTPWYHPDVDAYYAAGEPLPADHSNVDTKLIGLLPVGHASVDSYLRNPASHPLPPWHIKLDTIVLNAAYSAAGMVKPVSSLHPDPATMYTAGVAVPAMHPHVSFPTGALPTNHPVIDTVLQSPATNPLPAWHPILSSFVDIGGIVGSLNPSNRVSAPWYHPGIDEYYSTGTSTPVNSRSLAAVSIMPANHSSVDAKLVGILPMGHAAVDPYLRDPASHSLPTWHIKLDDIIQPSADTPSHVVGMVISVTSAHPDPQTQYKAGIAVPDFHPHVSFPTGALPTNHPVIDTVLKSPATHPLPAWHPILSNFVNIGGIVGTVNPTNRVSVPWFHPDIELTYSKGTPLPDFHKSVDAKLAGILPRGHASVDGYLLNPSAHPLPSWHIKLESIITLKAESIPRVSIAYDHPNIDEEYLSGQPIPDNHPDVNNLVASFLPSWHSKVDGNLRDPGAHLLCTGHIKLESIVARRSMWSPGLVFSVCMLVLFLLAWFARLMSLIFTGDPICGANSFLASWTSLDTALPLKNESQKAAGKPDKGRELTSFHHSRAPNVQKKGSAVSPSRSFGDVESLEGGIALRSSPAGGNRSAGSSGHFDRPATIDGNFAAGKLPPPRSLDAYTASQLHARHVGDPKSRIYEVEESRASPITHPPQPPYGPYGGGLGRRLLHLLTATRVPRSDWSTGNLLVCVGYVLVNALALAYAVKNSGYTVNRGLGSLAAANTAFLILPATRNNFLTLTLGLPFDHIVLYHRFLGRVTIFLGLLHAALYIPNSSSVYINAMGATALFFGLVIVATTFDFVRRKHFNLFFYTHYSFVGYFVFGYLHISQARPFLLAGVAIYAVDKLLRALWTLLPRRTIIFRNRGDGITQVRFHKNPISKCLGVYKVGQYMFVNFPEISSHEWHPFSVSSAPWEPFLELHMRALGDHTKEILAHAKKCVEEGRQTLIKSDGPYGVHDFDYRRYGTVVLVGGGVGITPVVGIMKELYGGYATGERGNIPTHNITKVLCIWVVPQTAEAETFLDDFKAMIAAAATCPGLPPLDLRIHCTRAKGVVDAPLVVGRPNFTEILDAAQVGEPGNPSLIFACGPGMMVNGFWDEANTRNASKKGRVDFHHETFEF